MSKTILVIDDDKLIRDGLGALLKSEGHTVLEAADGQEGLEIALAQHPDLVVTDIRMPNKDGLAMISELRTDEWGKTVPVIILTNDDTNSSVNQALQTGVTIYLAKDLDPDELTQQILQTLGE